MSLIHMRVCRFIKIGRLLRTDLWELYSNYDISFFNMRQVGKGLIPM